mmetsp:Transcript_132908/g.230965  ORF Transcript_132908/g.230965 Transcript_132908/m.230965 type:complete len:208 (+) Transcript_132908:434-1057(+)
MDNTGPNISSCAMVILLCTSAKTVGFTKNPSSRPSGLPSPPEITRAPSSIPFLMRPWIFSYCTRLATGPTCAFGSSAFPTRTPSATAFAIPHTSSYLDFGTNIRVNALHFCPLFSRSCVMNSGTSFFMSASSSMSAADLPPSSVLTTLRVSAAVRVISLPARVEPVKLIMSTSGCADRVWPTVWPCPNTMLKTPFGNPASWMHSATK